MKLRGRRGAQGLGASPDVLDDVARFSSGDNVALVAAALCCPLCLHTASQVVLCETAPGGLARCKCGRCDHVTSVGLDEPQFVRLVLAPPPGTRVRVA